MKPLFVLPCIDYAGTSLEAAGRSAHQKLRVAYQGIASLACGKIKVSYLFVSGHRFSDAVSLRKSAAPLGAGQRKSTFFAAC